jgi:hypothetical protein
MLFTGQAQKEVFVNEAHSRIDAVVHCAIEGSSATPPAAPSNGSNWLVGTGASGAWNGMEGRIACYQSGNWLFVTPFDGFRIFNRSTSQFSHYSSGWRTPASVIAATGGTTIDTQARTTLANLISTLQIAGILPTS